MYIYICIHYKYEYIYICIHISAASAAFASEPAAAFTTKSSISSVQKAALRSEAAADGCVMHWSWLSTTCFTTAARRRKWPPMRMNRAVMNMSPTTEWQIHAVEQVQDAQVVGVAKATKARARDGLWL